MVFSVDDFDLIGKVGNDYCLKSVQTRRFFWSVFFLTQAKYGDLQNKSPYLVRARDNTDQKTLRIWTLFTQWSFSI